MKPANRLQHIKEYYFATKLREVRAMVAAGKPVINIFLSLTPYNFNLSFTLLLGTK